MTTSGTKYSPLLSRKTSAGPSLVRRPLVSVGLDAIGVVPLPLKVPGGVGFSVGEVSNAVLYRFGFSFFVAKCLSWMRRSVLSLTFANSVSVQAMITSVVLASSGIVSLTLQNSIPVNLIVRRPTDTTPPCSTVTDTFVSGKLIQRFNQTTSRTFLVVHATSYNEKLMKEHSLFSDTQTLDVTPSERLMRECTGCRLIREPLITTRGISASDKAVAATAIGVKERRAFQGGSTKIYDPKHKAIQEHNDFFSRVEKYWKSLTLPLAAMRQEGDNGSGGKARVEGGTRLIKKTDMEKYQAQMVEFAAECKIVERHLNEQRSSILLAAREMLGDKKYDPSLYPEQFTISVFWGFPTIEIPAYYAKMAPQAYEHERQQVARRFEQNAELAYAEFLRGFHGVIATWVDRLGPRVRIHPPEGSPYEKMHRGEIVNRITAVQDESIPEGQFKLEVEYKDGSKKVTETIGPMTSAQYSELLPQEQSDEKKTFRDSTIENLLDQLDKFERLGDLICPSDNFKSIAREARQHLAQLGKAGDIAKELRSSTTFKNSTLGLMTKLSQRLEHEVTVIKQGSRKIIRGALKK
jgi:hypothetical protein